MIVSTRRALMPLGALLVALVVTTVAGRAAAQAPEDPLEGLNRRIFAFNQVVDGAFIEPAAIGYRNLVPRPGRTAIGNVFQNLSEPVNILNAALQGNEQHFGDSLGRLFINTTLGIGGIFDVAANLEPEYRREYVREDFGQTLAVWGWQDSAYFVIPFFGPSTIRDTGGFAVDFATTPWGYFAPIEVTVPMAALRAVDLRADVLETLDEIERSSLDFYASLRSIYLQRRQQQIFNGNVPQDLQTDPLAEDDIFAE